MIEIRQPSAPNEWAAATDLLLAYVDWLRDRVGVEPLEVQPVFRVELADLAEFYAPPATEFLIALDREQVVGTVAVEHHGDGSTELKRLFVSPTARQAGIGDRLITAAMTRAESAGSVRIWLETVRGVMDRAIALYRRHGFTTLSVDAAVPVDDMIVMERVSSADSAAVRAAGRAPAINSPAW